MMATLDQGFKDSGSGYEQLNQISNCVCIRRKIYHRVGFLNNVGVKYQKF